MDWTIFKTDATESDPSGTEGFIQRLDSEVRAGGPPLEGFKFLNSGSEMLRISREIEGDALKSAVHPTMYVGFQRPEKLTIELDRYRRLAEAGVRTVAYGHGDAPAGAVDVTEQWVDLGHDVAVFENQWYLVMAEPTPIVFIGWETSSPEMFGVGGISTAGKEFRGFVSTDRRVVDAAIGYLERVRRQHGPSAALTMDEFADEVPFPLRRIMIPSDDGQRPELAELRTGAMELAVKKSSALLLYDLSAASYLASPYPSEVYQREWNRTLGKRELNMAGRGYLTRQLEHLEAKGVDAGAILPTGHGFSQLIEWAEQEGADLIIIPESLLRPSLTNRIKGYTLKALENNTGIPVALYSSEGLVQMRTKADPNPERAQQAAPVKSV